MAPSAKKTPDAVKSNINLILAISILLSIFTILVFIFLSYWKQLHQKEIHEIGDALSGFSGFLAFLWIAVTIYIQSTELRLQQIEMRELAEANTMQAKLMADSFSVQALVYLRDLRSDSASALEHIAQLSAKTVLTFMEDFAKHPYASEFFNHPFEAVPYFYGYFVADPKDLLKLGFAIDERDLLDLEYSHIRKDFDYGACLLVSGLVDDMGKAWKIISYLRQYSDTAEDSAGQASWEARIGIDWVEDAWPLMQHLHSILDESFRKDHFSGQIHPTVRAFKKAFVSGLPPKLE
jgi:hypothetical protein